MLADLGENVNRVRVMAPTPNGLSENSLPRVLLSLSVNLFLQEKQKKIRHVTQF